MSSNVGCSGADARAQTSAILSDGARPAIAHSAEATATPARRRRIAIGAELLSAGEAAATGVVATAAADGDGAITGDCPLS